MKQPLILACDHAAFIMKQELKHWLTETGDYEITDLGTNSADSVDYPDFGKAAAEAVADTPGALGIILCGTGIGISIAANRHPDIRAALCHNSTAAALTRRHNDANILALGARMIGIEVAKDIVTTFLTTEFEGGRHARRVGKL